MPDLIYNVKFQIDDSQFQQQAAGVDGYTNQLEEANAEIAQLRTQLGAAANEQVRFNKSVKGSGDALGKTNKQVAIGNQLFFSLSDGIQDSAQFSQGFSTGMRAVGNNIGFTAELMAMYVAKTAQMNEGTATFSTVMRSLGSQMMGVGGIILALNLVITGLTVFTRRSKEAEKEVESLGDMFVQASSQISNSVFGESSYLITEGIIADLGKEFAILSDGIEESTGFFKNMSNAFLNGIDNMRLVGDETFRNAEAGRIFSQQQKDNAANSKSLKAQMQALISVTAEKIESSEEEARSILEVISNERKSIENKERMRKAIVALIPEAQDYYDIQEQTSRVLDEFNIGIDGSAQALESQKTAVGNLLTQYRNLYEDGNENLMPFLLELNKIYEDLTTAINKKTQAQINELEAQQDLRAAQQSADASFEAYLEEQEEKERKRREKEEQDRQKRLQAQKEFQAESRKAFLNPPDFDDGTIDRAEEKIVRRNLDLMQRQKDFRVQMVQDFAQAGFDLAKAAFGERKEIAIAEALISTYFAAQKAYESQFLPVPDPSSPVRGAGAAAAAVVAGLARVAQIKSTSIGGGGGGDTSSSSGASFGFQSTAVSGQPTFQTPSFSPTAQDGMVTPNISVDIKADRKQLYAIVKKGEEEYRSIKA